MKTILIVIYILLGIWALFSFDTVKPNIAFRYYLSNFSVNPFKIGLFTFLLFFLLIFSFFIVKSIFYENLISQYKSIEPIFTNFNENNIKVDTFKTTCEYVNVYEHFKSLKKEKDIKKEVLNFIDNSRFFHKNYPKAFSNSIAKCYNFPKNTQISIIRIEQYKETILFICQNENLKDKEVNNYVFEQLPNNDKLDLIFSSCADNSVISFINDYYDYFNKHGFGQYGSVGFCTFIDINYSIIIVPDPFEEKILNDLLLERIWLKIN